MCLVHGVHVAANKMSYSSFFIFLGCFQHVRTLVMLLIFRKELMHGHVWRLLKGFEAAKSRLGRNMQKIEKSRTRKSE